MTQSGAASAAQDPSVPVRLTFQFHPSDQFQDPPSPPASRPSTSRHPRLFIQTENRRFSPSSALPLPVDVLPSPTAALQSEPPVAFTAPEKPQQRFERLQPFRHPFQPLLLSSNPLLQPLHYPHPALHGLSSGPRPPPYHPPPTSSSSIVPASLLPSTAFLTVSKWMSPANVLSSAVVTSQAVLPRRPREGEVSRAGALHLDNFCPALLMKRAAKAVMWPLSQGTKRDE